MTSKDERLTIWYEEMDGDDYTLVGEGSTKLGEMIKAGIPVSPGFSITVHVMEKFITKTGIKEQLAKLVSGTDNPSCEEVKPASDAAMRLIETTELPSDLQSAIVSDYRKLCERSDVPDCPVTVRASAPDSSLIQAVSYVYIRGEKNLIDSVRRCWSSVYDIEGFMCRKNRETSLLPYIGVDVNKMVNPRVSGVIFTISPVNGDPSKIAIDASYGLREALASGLVTPDTYFIDKIIMEPVKTIIGSKEVQWIYNDKGSNIEQMPIPEEKQRVACLSHQETLELARIGRLIEEYYGEASNIEFAIDEDFPFPKNIVVLRVRPESVWSNKEAMPRTEKRKDALDRMVGQLIAGMKLEKGPPENVHRPSLSGHAGCCPLCTLRSLGR